jgi:hypothetical protein
MQVDYLGVKSGDRFAGNEGEVWNLSEDTEEGPAIVISDSWQDAVYVTFYSSSTIVVKGTEREFAKDNVTGARV